MPVDVLLSCTQCGKPFAARRFGNNVRCLHCKVPMDKLDQLGQLLAHWFYPRRWRADLLRPTPNFLIEKLWTANGQGEALFEGIAPPNVNFDIFRNMVTRTIARGVQQGWMDLTFPSDPLAENPVYKLKFKDPERFAREVEALFPDVDWDQQIQVPILDGGSAAVGDGESKAPSARASRRKGSKVR